VRGRFSREILIPVPDAAAKVDILKLVTRGIKLADDVVLSDLGKITPGYVGSDLFTLVNEAGVIAVKRILQSSVAVRSSTSTQPPPPDRATDSNNNIDSYQSVEKESVKDAVTTNGLHIPKEEDVCTNYFVFGHNGKSSAEGGIGERMAPVENISIAMVDFRNALKYIQPSVKREGFAVIPNVTWSDVGALCEVCNVM
jgi:ribosome biogenesis ATPase